MQRDLAAGIFRNVQAVVHCVSRARRDQVHIDDRPGGPGIALVDRIAVLINLQ